MASPPGNQAWRRPFSPGEALALRPHPCLTPPLRPSNPGMPAGTRSGGALRGWAGDAGLAPAPPTCSSPDPPAGGGYLLLALGDVTWTVNGPSIFGQLLINVGRLSVNCVNIFQVIFNWFSTASGQVGRVLRRSGKEREEHGPVGRWGPRRPPALASRRRR